MFEQASIESSGLLKRPWAITVSFAGQAAALSAVALVSLIHTDSLTPRAAFFTGVVGPPGSPPTNKQSTVKAATQAVKSPLRPFTSPANVPQGISPAGHEAAILSQDEMASGPGVIGGIDGISGQSQRLLGDAARLPAPPIEPVRHTQEKVVTNAPAR